LVDEPEERVRQEFVCKLVDEYSYSIGQMDEEKNLTENSDRGT
jgi:type I restriction enzyme M protein